MTSLVGQLSVWNECISQFDTTSHIFITGVRGSGKTTLVRELLQHYAKDKKRKNYHLWGYESVDECIPLQDFFYSYKCYCSENGYKLCSKKTFGERLKNISFTIERKSYGMAVYAKKGV